MIQNIFQTAWLMAKCTMVTIFKML
jgi:hypothetical protein